MRHPHWNLFAALGLLCALVLGGLTPTPAAAQGGYDDVTFWNDPGKSSATADIPAPSALAGLGYENVVILNPNGGRTTSDGLLVILSSSGVQVVRDRDWQIYGHGEDNIDTPDMRWYLFAEDFCIDSSEYCNNNQDDTLGQLVYGSVPDSETVELLQNGPTTWIARNVETTQINDWTFTLALTYTYTAPSSYIGIEARVTTSPFYTDTMHLYLAGDMYLDGNDEGPGFAGQYDGNFVVVQQNESSVGGISQTGRQFDSYFEGFYTCIWSAQSIADCGNSAAHWSADGSSPDHYFGPGFGEPYPMPAIINGRTEGDAKDSVDAGVAAHWDVTTNRNVTTSLVFYGRGAPAEPPAYCPQAATLEIKPRPIEIAPGGAATVWVELRNPCRDLPTAPADALLSFSDGMTVIETSQGVLNLGQRAALQRFSLGPGEMMGWYVIVRASNPLVTTPPVAIGEIFAGAAVVRTDSLNFITPAPAPAPAEPAPAPAEPAPAPAPAPLPAALPNTGGPLPLLWLPALAAGLAGAGVALRRNTRR